jgi:hypothetical protein
MDLTITIAERKRTASVVERVSYLLGSFARGGSCSLVGCRAEDAGLFGLDSVSLSAPVWRSWASAWTCRMRMAVVRSFAAGTVRVASWAWIFGLGGP